MKPEVRWPLVIIGLLVAQVCLGIFFVMRATSDPSFAVEEDYYQKAINWEAKQAQDRTNLELGWRLEAAIGPIDAGQTRRTVEVTLTESDGTPLTGAAVRLETFPNVRAGDILRATLEETEPGRYEVALPMLRAGVWELRFTAERGRQIFTQTNRSHLTAPRP